MASVPAKRAALLTLDREYALSQEKFQQLMAKQAQAAASLATVKVAMPSMRVVEYATPPAKKSWPRVKILYPAALFAGLLVGVGVALIRTYASGRLRREHVEHGRGSAPLYGVIGVTKRGRPLAALTSGKVPKTPAANRSEVNRREQK